MDASWLISVVVVGCLFVAFRLATKSVREAVAEFDPVINQCVVEDHISIYTIVTVLGIISATVLLAVVGLHSLLTGDCS